jgi:hypothetical protein
MKAEWETDGTDTTDMRLPEGGATGGRMGRGGTGGAANVERRECRLTALKNCD